MASGQHLLMVIFVDLEMTGEIRSHIHLEHPSQHVIDIIKKVGIPCNSNYHYTMYIVCIVVLGMF